MGEKRMENVFFDIGMLVIIATLLGYFARLIKQPLIPAYILAGVLIGPEMLGLVTDAGLIRNLAEIGIAFLLFMVGLELDFSRLKSISHVGAWGGILKAVLLSLAGFIVALALGLTVKESLYLALVLSATSTLVVVKLLSDKQELDTLHGRIVLGMLVMEDILGILFLAVLSPDGVRFPLLAILEGAVVLTLLYLLTRVIFPNLFRFGAMFSELLVLLSLSVCFLFAMISHSFGLSIAIGAYIGGVSLANLPYHWEIASRIKPVRDFFAVIFFVTLGMELTFSHFGSLLPTLAIMVLFVLLFKPFFIMMLVTMFGYTIRTSFLTAISLTPVDEFSIIIVTAGFLSSQISESIFTLTILIASISIVVSSYLIEYDKKLYAILRKFLERMPLRGAIREFEFVDDKAKYDVVLIGYDRTGYSIVRKLRNMKKRLLVIDFNPEIIRKLVAENIHCMYGDISDIEMLERIDFKHVELVISTVSERTDNLMLIRKIKQKNPKTSIFVTAYQLEDALELYDSGADYVILPHFIGGDHVAVILEEVTTDLRKLLSHKIKHIEELKLRHHLGHEHHP
ncbi:MAG: cation:proton antiporter [Nanoarchaeota archaeon]